MRMMIMIVSVEQRPGSTEHVKTYLPNVIFSILHGKVRFISKLWMIQSRFLDELPRSPNGSCFRNLIFFSWRNPQTSAEHWEWTDFFLAKLKKNGGVHHEKWRMFARNMAGRGHFAAEKNLVCLRCQAGERLGAVLRWEPLWLLGDIGGFEHALTNGNGEFN